MKFPLFLFASFLWLLQINFCAAQQLYAEISLGGSMGWHKMHQTSEPTTPYLQSFPTFTVGRALGVVYETPKHIFRLKYGKYATSVSAGVLTSTTWARVYAGGMFEHNYRLLYERKLSVIKNKFQYCIGGGVGINRLIDSGPATLMGTNDGKIRFYVTASKIVHYISPHLVVSNGFLYHSKNKKHRFYAEIYYNFGLSVMEKDSYGAVIENKVYHGYIENRARYGGILFHYGRNLGNPQQWFKKKNKASE